jgi:hypothetical protein
LKIIIKAIVKRGRNVNKNIVAKYRNLIWHAKVLKVELVAFRSNESRIGEFKDENC